MVDKRVYVERRPQEDYDVRKANSQRASSGVGHCLSAIWAKFAREVG
jgi:hypothetical protein